MYLRIIVFLEYILYFDHKYLSDKWSIHIILFSLLKVSEKWDHYSSS